MKKRFKQIVLTLLVVLVAFGVFAKHFYDSNSRPISETSNIVQFISDQSTLDATITKLVDEKIIRNELVAKIIAKFNNFDQVYAGTYEIDTAWDTKQILEYLQDVNHVLKKNVFKATFIDGLWAKDYAKVIAQHTAYTEQEIIELWNNVDFVRLLVDKYEVLTDDLLKDGTNVKLEGYIAPDTYEFYSDSSLEEITEKLIMPTEQFYLDNKALFDQSNLSIYEVFTLASIVQKEANNLEDQKMVASVFYNRLNQNMNLGSSITLCYAKYETFNYQNCESDATIDSPYNTYIHNGLPIGPVSNVSKQALLATLEPADSDYLYFMADVLGPNASGKIFFSKTFEEHDAYVQKYLR